MGVGQVARVPGGLEQLDAGADHQAFVVGELPPDLVAARLKVVRHLERGPVHHVCVPVAVGQLGEGEMGGVAIALKQPRPGQRGAGVGGRGLLRVRYVPPQPARIRAATGRIPGRHHVGVDLARLVEIPRVARQIVGARQSQRHPALVIVVTGKPSALVLAGVEALDQAAVLLAARALHAVEHRVPAVGVGPITGEPAAIRIIAPQILLPAVPELEQETLERLVGPRVIRGRRLRHAGTTAKRKPGQHDRQPGRAQAMTRNPCEHGRMLRRPPGVTQRNASGG